MTFLHIHLIILINRNISSSQQNFFRMIDQKIDEVTFLAFETAPAYRLIFYLIQGPDYDSTSETEIALEEARMNALIQHWESASLPTSVCSSNSRSLQSTPIRQVQLRYIN